MLIHEASEAAREQCLHGENALVWVQHRFMDRALIRMQCIGGKAGVRMLLWYNIPRKGSHTGGNKRSRETREKWCRWDNDFLCKLPIGTSFYPQNISRSL